MWIKHFPVWCCETYSCSIVCERAHAIEANTNKEVEMISIGFLPKMSLNLVKTTRKARDV
jgi:hypothetical protein